MADCWPASRGILSDAPSNPKSKPSEDFISANLRPIFLQIYRRVQSIDDAQELTQQVFVKALSKSHSLRDPHKSANWLSRIASSTVVEFIRSRRNWSTVAPETILNAPDSRARTPEDIVISECEQTNIRECLRALSNRERTALVWRDVYELPAEEVAQRMGCSQATVRSHIANARIKLRRALRPK